jgi:hypothetical protein
LAVLLALILPLQAFAAESGCSQLGIAPAAAGTTISDAATHCRHGAAGEQTSTGKHGATDEHGATGEHGATDEHGATGEHGATPEHGAPTAQHHNCGTCCCIASIAGATVQWMAPRSAVPNFSLPLNVPPPAIVLDRLDRPPRR